MVEPVTPLKPRPKPKKAPHPQDKGTKPAPGSALTPQARKMIDNLIAAIQRNPAGAVVAFGVLALGVLIVFG